MAGRFISLEGGEGAGKSTLAKGLAQYLSSQGLEVVVTREPGGTSNAEAVRSLLVEGDVERWSPMGEALLLYAAREDHVRNLIEPALASGKWVISDRFADSTTAYQVAAGGLDRQTVETIHAQVLGHFRPDLTFVVDLDPEVGLQRTIARGEGATRFEQQPTDFHQTLRSEFLDIARQDPVRCAVLDGAVTQATVLADAIAVLNDRMDLS